MKKTRKIEIHHLDTDQWMWTISQWSTKMSCWNSVASNGKTTFEEASKEAYKELSRMERQDSKVDMSSVCGMRYFENNTDTEEWKKWYKDNCTKCKYMCEVCMR